MPVVLTNGAKIDLSAASGGPSFRIVLRDYRVEKVIQKRVCKCDGGGRENPFYVVLWSNFLNFSVEFIWISISWLPASILGEVGTLLRTSQLRDLCKNL